ncbi:MAG: MFS transporter [Candidatus Thorarchaeota archaeon]
MTQEDHGPEQAQGGALSESQKRNMRVVAYALTVLATFSLGVTEIFAPWYAGVLGASPWEMGWAMGSFGVVYMFSPAIGGKVSDRIGRRNALLVATTSYMTLLLIYPQPFVTPIHLIVIRALEGLFFGLYYPSIEGLVAELSPASQVAVLGNFSSSWSAGMVLSPMVIAYMSQTFGNVSSIYVVLGVELFSLALIFLFIGGYRPEQVINTVAPDAGRAADLAMDRKTGRQTRTSPKFIASFVSVAMFGFISTLLLALYPTYIETLPGYTAVDFGALLMTWNISRTLTFASISRLRKEHMELVMLMGGGVSSVSMLMIWGSQVYLVLWLASVMCGIGVGCAYLAALYVVVSATDIEKGAHAGLVESLAGVGFFIGPVFGGWIAGGDTGSSLPYLATALYSAVSLLVIAVLLRKSRRHTPIV